MRLSFKHGLELFPLPLAFARRVPVRHEFPLGTVVAVVRGLVRSRARTAGGRDPAPSIQLAEGIPLRRRRGSRTAELVPPRVAGRVGGRCRSRGCRRRVGERTREGVLGRSWIWRTSSISLCSFPLRKKHESHLGPNSRQRLHTRPCSVPDSEQCSRPRRRRHPIDPHLQTPSRESGFLPRRGWLDRPLRRRRAYQSAWRSRPRRERSRAGSRVRWRPCVPSLPESCSQPPCPSRRQPEFCSSPRSVNTALSHAVGRHSPLTR